MERYNTTGEKNSELEGRSQEIIQNVMQSNKNMDNNEEKLKELEKIH